MRASVLTLSASLPRFDCSQYKYREALRFGEIFLMFLNLNGSLFTLFWKPLCAPLYVQYIQNKNANVWCTIKYGTVLGDGSESILQKLSGTSIFLPLP